MTENTIPKHQAEIEVREQVQAHQDIFRAFSDGLANRLAAQPALRIRLIAAR